MTTLRMLMGAVAVLFSASAITSCDKAPLQPSATRAPGASPIIRVEVAGGPVAPGASTQYSATGHYGDGTSRDVTREAAWSATPGRLSVTPEGLVTGLSVGTGDVRAVVRRPDNVGVTGVRTIHVVPLGTFRIAGRVTEVGAPTFGLSGARVRVEGEPSVGEDVTNELGQFALYGAPNPATIVASRDGHGTARVRVTPTEHLSVFLYNSYPTVAEFVAPNSYFVPFGTATLKISSTGLAGPFDGGLRLSTSVLGGGTGCQAGDHRIEMTR